MPGIPDEKALAVPVAFNVIWEVASQLLLESGVFLRHVWVGAQIIPEGKVTVYRRIAGSVYMDVVCVAFDASTGTTSAPVSAMREMSTMPTVAFSARIPSRPTPAKQIRA